MVDEILQKAAELYQIKLGLYLEAGVSIEGLKDAFLRDITKAKQEYLDLYLERQREEIKFKYDVLDALENNLDTYLLRGQLEYINGKHMRGNSMS